MEDAQKTRRWNRFTGWTCLILCIANFSIYFYMGKDPAFIILGVVSGLVCFALFSWIIPTSYRKQTRMTYRKWHPIHGERVEEIIFEYDERTVKKN